MLVKIIVERSKRYWELVTRPSDKLLDDNERQSASLTAALLACLLLSAIGVLPIWMLTVPQSPNVWLISAGVIVTLLVAYILSRTAYYRVGTLLLIAFIPALVVVILMTTTNPSDERLLVLTLFIAILVTSIILNIRATAVVTILCLVLIVSVFYIIEVTFNTAFSYLVTMIGLAALIVVSAAMRKHYAIRLRESQQQLDAFFAQSLDGIYFMMLDAPLRWDTSINKDATLEQFFSRQRVTRANDAILLQFGKTRDEFLGTTPKDLFAYDLALGKTLWRQMLDNGRLRTEIEIHRPDGSSIWVEIDHVCFYTADGRITGHFGVQRDVSKRKQAELKLRTAEAQYRALFEQSHDAVFFMTLEGKNITTNQRSANLFGYSVEELQKMSVDEISAEREESNAVREQLIRGEHVPTFIRRFRKKNGDIIPVEINVEIVRDANGVPIHIQSVARDVTERLRSEETLRATEARQRALLQAIPDLMFRIGRDSTYRDYHAPSPEQLAAPPELFLGRKVSEVLPPATAEAHIRLIAHVLQTGEEATYEYELPIDGKTMYFELRMVKCGADEVLTIVRDVTSRKQVEQALQQSEARFSSAFRNSPVPMVISTSEQRDSRYVEANQAYLDMVGYTWEELAGQQLVDMGIAIYDEQHKARSSLLSSMGRYATQEAKIRNRSGDIYDILIWAERIEFGEQTLDLEIILDVTERRKLQEQQFALAVEKERVKVLNQFVQNSSHEFRTPLAIINTNLYLLDKIDDKEAQHRYIEQCKQQIVRLEQLLRTMMTMTSLDTGAQFIHSSLDVNALVREIADDVQPDLAKKALTLEVKLAPALPTLQADRRWLKVALDHLLSNAIHFTPMGGTLTLRTDQRDECAIIEVCDTGVGIDRDAAENMFTRFWRQDEAHSTPGFGLGLPMAQKIVQRHGGQLEVDSEVGKGSVFRIVLPMA